MLRATWGCAPTAIYKIDIQFALRLQTSFFSAFPSEPVLHHVNRNIQVDVLLFNADVTVYIKSFLRSRLHAALISIKLTVRDDSCLYKKKKHSSTLVTLNEVCLTSRNVIGNVLGNDKRSHQRETRIGYAIPHLGPRCRAKCPYNWKNVLARIIRNPLLPR